MRLLVIEDDRQIASGLRDGLQQAGFTVHLVHDGVFAAEALAQEQHDCVILDLGLPTIDGMTLLQQYRKRNFTTPVLILTARDELQDKVTGLNAGADDYLAKPFDIAELEARIRALLRRTGTLATPSQKQDIRVGLLRLSGSERRIFCGAKPVELSPREFGVLELLMQRVGRVVSKAQIQDHLAVQAHGVSDSSGEVVGDTAIEVYVHRVRKKIEQVGVEIVTVRGFGYLLQILPATNSTSA